MPVFEAVDDGIRWSLEPWEAGLLGDLRDDLRTLLTSGDPHDPALRRLHPPAVSGDAEADEELRDLIRDELLTGRLAGLDALVAVLGRADAGRDEVEVVLVDEEPYLLLGVLNDLRLALAARAGADRLDPGDLPDDDPRVPTLALVQWLAFHQESLLAVVDPPALSHYDDHPTDD